MTEEKTFRILFVEDLETDKLIAEREIVKNGLKIISKRIDTEVDFKNSLLEFSPDIIISDYSMPSFDGMTALQIVLERKLNTPFLILTGSMNENIAVECMKAGADDYILKENLNRLVPAIWAAINKHEFILAKQIAEIKLLESERRFKSLFHDNLTVMLLIDPLSNGIVDVNRAAEKYYGWVKKELLKMKIDDLNLMPSMEFHKKIKNIKKEIKEQYEIKQRKADGSVRDVEVSLCVIESGNKRLLHLIIHDVTEKKIAQRELLKKSLAIEQSQVSIVITDLKGDIEYVNPMFTKVTGYSFSDVIGKNPRILKSGEQKKDFYKSLWNTIIKGEKWSGIFNNRKKNGENYWESSIISPIKNEMNKITHFVAVKEDITELIKQEYELKKYRENLEELVEARTAELDNVNKKLNSELEERKILEKQLEISLTNEKEINELKTRFISTVSHEFRTPLAALLTSSQMIQRYSKEWNKEKIEKYYTRIEETIKYLTQLLDEILTINRFDREVLKNNPDRCNVFELFSLFEDEIRSLLPDSQKLKVDLKINDSDIYIDRKLLRHIVINLLTNAIKYSPSGSVIKLSAKLKMNKLNIIIKDKGIGIAEDELKYIFDAFYRARNSIGIQGSGLGLQIVKLAVEAMGGSISVKSGINLGTTFNVIIPMRNK